MQQNLMWRCSISRVKFVGVHVTVSLYMGKKAAIPRSAVSPVYHTSHDEVKENKPPQQNLWSSFGSGSRPKA